MKEEGEGDCEGDQRARRAQERGSLMGDEGAGGAERTREDRKGHCTGPRGRGVSDLGLDGEVGPDRPGLEEHGREEVWTVEEGGREVRPQLWGVECGVEGGFCFKRRNSSSSGR